MSYLDNDGHDRNHMGLFNNSSNGSLGYHNQYEQFQAGVNSYDSQFVAELKTQQYKKRRALENNLYIGVGVSSGPASPWFRVFLLATVVALGSGYFWYDHWTNKPNLPVGFPMPASSAELRNPEALAQRCVDKAMELSDGVYSRRQLEYKYDVSKKQCRTQNGYPVIAALVKESKIKDTTWKMGEAFALSLAASWGVIWLFRRKRNKSNTSKARAA